MSKKDNFLTKLGEDLIKLGGTLQEKVTEFSKELEISLKDMEKEAKKFEQKAHDAMKNSTTAKTVEVYGATKSEALAEANKKTVEGFKLVSVKENTETGVWTVVLSKPLV